MKTQKILNEEGEVLKTKEGVELTDNFLEVGDELIVDTGIVIEKSRDVLVKGVEKNITDFSIIGSVKQKDGKLFESTKDKPFFIKLTPTQAISLKKMFEENKDINQEVLNVYGYTNKYGEQIGIGFKRNFKDPIKF